METRDSPVPERTQLSRFRVAEVGKLMMFKRGAGKKKEDFPVLLMDFKVKQKTSRNEGWTSALSNEAINGTFYGKTKLYYFLNNQSEDIP
jgi:hypothetical protein